MSAPRNAFKRRLLAGETVYGLWLMSTSPVMAEAASLVGFDWLLFDTEHSPIDIGGVQPLLQAAAAGASAILARPAWNDRVLIKRMLDIGAQTLVVPFVETADEARQAVISTRYPPLGRRGVSGGTRASRYGFAPDYFTTANDEICLLVQVETREAVAELDAIAAVDGVDGVFIGPADLAASLGHLGNPGHPDVVAVLKDALARILAVGKAPGILAMNAETARTYAEWGYRFVGVGTDMGLFAANAKAALAAVASPS
nr:HpcH/HpaI aldolase/citrate lyase family protein [Martelella endophytica]